jgi:fatty acid desaturase
MTGWRAEGAQGRSAKVVIALTLLALLLLAAVPAALLAAVIMMILGQVVGGLALFGGSVLAAVVAVALAGMTGMQHLRKVLSRASFDVGPLHQGHDPDDVAHPEVSDYPDVVQLDRSEYTEVR